MGIVQALGELQPVQTPWGTGGGEAPRLKGEGTKPEKKRNLQEQSRLLCALRSLQLWGGGAQLASVAGVKARLGQPLLLASEASYGTC